MEGGAGPVKSVRRQLSWALALAIVAVALMGSALSFLAAYDEARELQDDVLRQIAQLVDARQLRAQPQPLDGHFLDRDEAARVVVQSLGAPNPEGLHVDAGGALPLPTTLGDGLHTLELNGESFRVLVHRTAGGERFAVAQESDLRDEMARASAWRTVLPFALLMPVLLLVVADLVRKLFRPIARLAQEVDQRSEAQLHPVSEDGVPGEVRPFVHAINRLLARVQHSMAEQQRFIANAAHELRTPLAALSLQAQRLEQTALPPAAAERLAELRTGMERSRHLLDQLLGLARAQAAGSAPDAPQSMQALFREVIQDLLPLAEAKGIDLGVQGMEGTQDAQVQAARADLSMLLKNLVDNAIRYTPAGGRVDLSWSEQGGELLLQVRDNGPGISQEQRAQVFAPFYRLPGSGEGGSGLGLAIVQALAERMGARVVLDWSNPQQRRGLCASVLLPRAVA
ncbi:MAG: two-component sensor histidine kinase [Proteobacteria bacterium]|nr:two-component sensor histidine kinase [Pseudomonadota bacterium]